MCCFGERECFLSLFRIIYLEITEELGSVALAEISRQPGTDCVVWFLAITLVQTYNEKQQVGRGEAQSV